jgi:lipoprotein-releasing system permease protein
LNTALFISRRLGAGGSSSFTRVIVRLGILAVAVSLCVLLVASSLIAGFQREITQKVFNFWGHIHITHVDSDRSIDAVPINQNQAFITEIAAIESVQFMVGPDRTMVSKGGVKSMHPFIHYPGILSTRSAFDGVICKGVDELFDWTFIKEYLVAGDIFDDTTSQPYHDQCLISSIQANRLEVELGDALLLNFIIDRKQIKKRITIKGIYDTGLEEYDKKFILVDMHLLQNVLDWDRQLVSGFSIFLDDVDDLQVINEFIYIEKLPPQLYSESIKSKFPGIFEWLKLQQVNEYVLLIIMLIVAFINLSTVLIILILDRAKMVATLKSLGARTFEVMRIFIYVIGGIIIKGFLLGNVLAFLLCFLQDKFRIVKLNQADYYLSYAPVEFDIPKILLINVFAFIVILLFMIIPALVISSIKPVKILRFA